jgi:hypothetical protein
MTRLHVHEKSCPAAGQSKSPARQAALSERLNARAKFKVRIDTSEARDFHWIFTGWAV